MDDEDDDLITVDALTKFAEQQTAKELEKKAAEQVEDEKTMSSKTLKPQKII